MDNNHVSFKALFTLGVWLFYSDFFFRIKSDYLCVWLITLYLKCESELQRERFTAQSWPVRAEEDDTSHTQRTPASTMLVWANMLLTYLMWQEHSYRSLFQKHYICIECSRTYECDLVCRSDDRKKIRYFRIFFCLLQWKFSQGGVIEALEVFIICAVLVI